MDSRWSVDRVPTPKRWLCETCGTPSDHIDQPALGGYGIGVCSNKDCPSRKDTRKGHRAQTFFVPQR